MIEIKNETEKVILVGVSLSDQDDTKESLEEFSGKKMKKEMQYNIIVAYEQMEDWESAKVKLEEYLENYPNDKSAKKEAEFLKTR